MMGEERHDISRRGFLGAAAGTAAAAAVGLGASDALAATTPTGTAGDDGDLALVNGKIHAFDENDSVVSQLLIRNGRVARVGSIGGGGAKRVINLHGRTVIPGLIGNHEHFIRIGNAVGHDVRQLETAFSIGDAQRVIAAKASEIPEGEFITCLAGIARRQFADPARFPNLQELDDAAPRHPVVISELSVGQTNSLGRDRLRSLGVPVDDNGFVPNEGAAYTALSAFITNETRKRELLSAADYALSLGLTTIHDQHGSTGGAGFLDRVTGHDVYLELVRDGLLNVRTRCFIPEQDDPSCYNR